MDSLFGYAGKEPGEWKNRGSTWLDFMCQETLVEEHLKQEFVDIPVITEEVDWLRLVEIGWDWVRLGETRLRLTFTRFATFFFSILLRAFLCWITWVSRKHARECQHFTLDPALPVTNMILSNYHLVILLLLIQFNTLKQKPSVEGTLWLHPKLRCSVLAIKGRHFAFMSCHVMASHGIA